MELQLTSSTNHQCSFCNKDQKQVKKLISGNDVYICDECIELCFSLISTTEEETKPNYSKDGLTPEVIKAYLDERVIGQDYAKKYLSVAAYNHFKRIKNPIIDGIEIDKSNVLMIGSSGVGKTFLLQNLAKLLNVPMVIVDASEMTENGYVGLDTSDCLVRLYQAAEQDLSKAEQGIVYIDEIDKKGRKGENPSITRDVGGEGVQQALLKLIEGAEIKIPQSGGKKHPSSEFITFNTKNVLFIVGGSFEGLKEIISKRMNAKSGIGFGSTIVDNKKIDDSILKQVRSEDIVKFGIIPEMVGRLPIVVPFNELTEDDLVRILTEPKHAIITQFQKLFKVDGVELEFTQNALLEIAKLALERKTGARGLRSIIEHVLLPIQFELASYKKNNIVKIVINESCILDKSDPIKIYGSDIETK